MTINTSMGLQTPEDPRGSQVLARAFEKKTSAGDDGSAPADPFKSPKGNTLTRVMRSHQLWLTLTYFGLLVLMARGIAS